MSEGVVIPLPPPDSAKEPEPRCRVCGERLNPNGNCIGILLKVEFCLAAHGIQPRAMCERCRTPIKDNGQCEAFDADAPFWMRRAHGLIPDMG